MSDSSYTSGSTWQATIAVRNPNRKWWEFRKPRWIRRRCDTMTKEEIEKSMRYLSKFRLF